jgi:competence protein ComEC
MTSSKVLFYFCVSFIAGIFLESFFRLSQAFLWAFLFIGLLVIFFAVNVRNEVTKQSREYGLLRRLRAPRNDEIIVAGFCLLFFTIGVLRMQISEFNVANDKLSELNGTGKIVLTGVINADPKVGDTSQRLEVDVLNSTILVTTGRYPEYNYLDEIKLTGKLEAPVAYDDFNYKNYLLPHHIYSVMSFPKIEAAGYVKENFLLTVYGKILKTKSKMKEAIQKNILPPEGALLQAMVLGDKGQMPQDLKNNLSATGLSHVAAVSGMHVAVLTIILMSFLLAAGLWRQQALCVTIIFICFYVVMVGLPASAIRASIMGIIVLLGQSLGRQTKTARIIFLAASLMLLQNPLLLIYDVGFQLSFLAVLGIIYFEPILGMFFRSLSKRLFLTDAEDKQQNILDIFAVTISAQIFTLPVIVFNFGIVSLSAPLTNLLVVPFVSYVMFFGFLSAVSGIFWGWLSWILSVPCYFLLSYFVWVASFFSKPWAKVLFQNVSWIWLLLSYVIIFSLTWFLNKKYAQKFV